MFFNGFIAEVDSEIDSASSWEKLFTSSELVGEIHGSERRRDVQSNKSGGPGTRAFTSFSQISSSTSRARRSASHALAATICSSGGLVLSPSLSFAASSARDFGDGTLAAKLKYYCVERALRLPGKLER